MNNLPQDTKLDLLDMDQVSKDVMKAIYLLHEPIKKMVDAGILTPTQAIDSCENLREAGLLVVMYDEETGETKVIPIIKM